MSVRIFTLLLILAASSSVVVAQPLRLGSTRAEVMQQVYRAGSFTDTLKEGSFLIDQLNSYRNTGIRQHYAEAIRIAPVRMFDIDGYGQFLFDKDGRLVHYAWMRQDMTEYALGAAWTRFLDWKSDVVPGTYQRVNDQLRQVKPATKWSGEMMDSGSLPTDQDMLVTLWDDSVETMRLSWYDGALTFYHHSK